MINTPLEFYPQNMKLKPPCATWHTSTDKRTAKEHLLEWSHFNSISSTCRLKIKKRVSTQPNGTKGNIC